MGTMFYWKFWGALPIKIMAVCTTCFLYLIMLLYLRKDVKLFPIFLEVQYITYALKKYILEYLNKVFVTTLSTKTNPTSTGYEF